MSIQKAEMSVEQKENGQIVEYVAYPYVEYEHVTMENGMDIMSMIRDDVSTPMVTHDATSWRVGQGDGDVSKSIVDSSVAIMTIKGQTYQNILPSPSLRNSMTNGKTMQKLNEGYDSVNTVDGVCKSAILSGQTLVNLIKNGYTATSTPNKEHAIASIMPLDGSKEYTLMINKNLVQVNVRFWYTDGSYGNDYAFSHRAESGYIKNKLRIDRANATGKTLENIQIYSVDANGEITNMMLLEGDYTNVDIPYFTGMQSVKMPVLTTTGKNLFDKSKIKKGYAVSSSNPTTESAYAVRDYMDYIEVESGATYKLSNCTTTAIFGYKNKGDYYGYVSLNGTNAIPHDVKYIRFNIDNSFDYSNAQLEKNTVATSFEPYKSNILSTPSDLVLRGIGTGSNRVEDKLNCLTGEVTERVGEYQITGEENWHFLPGSRRLQILNPTFTPNIKCGVFACDKLQAKQSNDGSLHSTNGTYYIGYTSDNWLRIILGEDLTSLEQGKEWLKANKPTIQYQLKTESIKTVDLSTSGNWEKVVLNGSEDWAKETLESGIVRWRASLPNAIGNAPCYCDKLPVYPTSDKRDVDYVRCSTNLVWVYQKDTSLTPEQFRAKLQSNPLTVWYQVKTHQDSTQVKQPIFFKDGHIQLSSGADNSLIPTLDYEAKTSNSYVMDLMKTNTRYTMKAKSASGTFTIDGTSYGAGTNGTFTTPTSMTNKLLVMSDTAHEEVMIIEGDVTSKAIPYFKGIKSAFEDESKIEVLSTGKNLYSHGDSAFTPERDGWYFINGDRETLFGDKVHKDCGQGAWFYLEGGRYYFNVVGNDNVKILQVIGEKERLYGSGATIPKGWYALRMRVQNANQEVSITNVMVEKDTETNYEPYKSNSTKIPLLSPLRGLPNGVYDELIIDRMKKKATLIQRIKSTVFNGSEGWNLNNYSHDKLIEFVCHSGTQMAHTVFSDRFITGGENVERVAFSGGSIFIRILKTKVSNVDSFKKWLSQNPLTVQYGLQTPIITEVNLEGYPYVYKGGHIFLNTEIAPTTEVTYSINQAHQIESSNEDILRHQKEINHLYELIAQYVQVQYEAELIDIALQG